jgi:hypothetical protein
VEHEVPAGKRRCSNYATHKHPKALAWLSGHPRWIFHFTPTSASWLNAVENFFSKMTRQRIRRGVFRSIVDLQSAINAYLAEHNAHPKPFVWTRSAKAILAKLVFLILLLAMRAPIDQLKMYVKGLRLTILRFCEIA